VVHKSQVLKLLYLTADSDDAIIGLRLTNVTANSVTVDVYIDKGGVGTDRYIAKNLSIPPASSIELIQGGAKIVMQSWRCVIWCI
jgi:copper(I)-binding protein